MLFLIIDMQNDFVRKGAWMEVNDAIKTVDVYRKLIKYFSENLLRIIFTMFIAEPDYSLIWEWSPMCGTEEKTCWKGVRKKYRDKDVELDGTDIIDEIYPYKEDYIIEKCGYSAFYNTELEDVLKKNCIEYLVITGTVTQICVENTVRDAFHRQLKCIVAEDAVSSFSKSLHYSSLQGLEMKYCRVSDSDAIIRELSVE